MKNKTSVFSWFKEQVNHSDATFQWMDCYQMSRIYQSFAKDDSKEAITTFLHTAKKYNKEVYILGGEAEWALEKNRQEIIHFINGVTQYQPLVKGIVLDVEPHTLTDFKEIPKLIMKSFTENLKSAYSFAKSHQLEVIVCLPYYYDTLGYKAELETIIRFALDEAAIMNYYRGKEIEHIHFEAELCHKFQKSIQTIYELQPPRKHGLKDQHTYYNKGLKAVYHNYNELESMYPKQQISLSFHEFQSFKELAKRE